MSRKRNITECSKYGCKEPPYLGGLCKAHNEENRHKEVRRDAAIHALHFGSIDGSYPKNAELHEELEKIRKWWHRACDAVNYGRVDDVLLDEAEYALKWCISLAQEIVDAEIAYRTDASVSESFAYTKQWVWERFQNLEAGLMSNGIERKT